MRLDALLHADAAAAIAALEAVGARHDARLDLVTDVAGVGPVVRRFGVLQAPSVAAADAGILDPFRAALALPVNAAVAAKMASRPYCPGSKRAVAAIGPALLARRLHLPWALRPMNMDFSALVSRAHREAPYPFAAWYSETVQVTDGIVKPGRLFSMPSSGKAERTVLEPEEDDTLDPKIGVILEAQARP